MKDFWDDNKKIDIYAVGGVKKKYTPMMLG